MANFSADREAKAKTNMVGHAVAALRFETGVFQKDFRPEFALTLGSGLGELARNIDATCVIPYEKVGLPVPGVEGHKGELVVGHIQGVPIIGLSGRKHFYETASQEEMFDIVFPVHVMASFGTKIYFGTNAVGGLNPAFRVGDLMVVKDHLDLFMPDPLRGPHLDFGRNNYFQPQNGEYDPELRSLFRKAAADAGAAERVHDGVYTARTGRTYETAADSRALRQLGADAVGMSLIPEIIAAANRGMRTLAVSFVTNVVAADGTNATSHEEVVAALDNEETRKRTAAVFSRFFELYRETPRPL